MSGGPALRLASPDLDAARDRFVRTGRTVIEPVLKAKDAETLHHAMATFSPWGLVTCVAGQHRTFDAAGMDVLDPAKRKEFDALVHAGAASGFQYLFENMALYELGRKGALDGVMRAAFELVRSQAFLDLARSVTGCEDISFSDCQLTRYRGGHFLTEHDDAVEGKARRAAYVLNMTPDWRADYGGQLQFLTDTGDVEEAFTPRFNRLALFKVPARHAVSCVAPFAPSARYAITGWLRAGDEPAL
ncbi:MAG: 2OG-Fe(II) oxygenase family protein [Oceanicaulis sp.]